MKKLLKAIGIAVVSLVVVLGAVILGARWIYGPLGPIPGPKLTGTVVEDYQETGAESSTKPSFALAL